MKKEYLDKSYKPKSRAQVVAERFLKDLSLQQLIEQCESVSIDVKKGATREELKSLLLEWALKDDNNGKD